MDADPKQGPRDPFDSLWRLDSPLMYLCIVGGGILGVIGAVVIIRTSPETRFRGMLYVGFLGGGVLGCLLGGLVLGIIDFVRQSARGNANIASCPSCRGKVQIPEGMRGLDVACPMCKATFTAPDSPQSN